MLIKQNYNEKMIGMDNAMEIGAALVIIGIIIMAGYGIYMFAVSEEIPLFMRAGMIALVLGIAVIIVSVMRDRIMELKKEG